MGTERQHERTPGSRTGAGTGGGDRNGTGGGDGLGRFRHKQASAGELKRGPGMNVNRGARSGLQDVVLFLHEGANTPKHSGAAQRIVCCVDDTDDLSGDTSTGFVSEKLAQLVLTLGGSVIHGITRHQLLLAEGIPYTSHNSSMCFMAMLPVTAQEEFLEKAAIIVERESVTSADPGLCIAFLPSMDDPCTKRDETQRLNALIAFGGKAQSHLCTKKEALALADEIPWLHLSEHGGTGAGIIGALAGTGLRIGGSDGRFRGKWNLRTVINTHDDHHEVGAFCSKLSKLTGGKVRVLDRNGSVVDAGEQLALVKEAKPILHDNALSFIVDFIDGIAYPAEKVDLGTLGQSHDWSRICERYKMDNDVEECTTDLRPSCRNCLLRRWTEHGFTCVSSEKSQVEA